MSHIKYNRLPNYIEDSRLEVAMKAHTIEGIMDRLIDALVAGDRVEAARLARQTRQEAVSIREIANEMKREHGRRVQESNGR